MSNKPIVLTLTYFGKSITVKNDTMVLHPSEVMEMFKNIYIGTFGKDSWDNVLRQELDRLTLESGSSTPQSITSTTTEQNEPIEWVTDREIIL